MQHEPRHTQADANFIEMGGLKSWGCYAFVVSVLVLIGVTTGAGFLWIRRRRRQRVAQEEAWQRAMRS